MVTHIHPTILAAAVLLDDIASGTLSQEAFYAAMMEAGRMSVDLCKMILARGCETKDAAIGRAAECLKNLCLDSDLERWKAARDSAHERSQELFQLLKEHKL